MHQWQRNQHLMIALADICSDFFELLLARVVPFGLSSSDSFLRCILHLNVRKTV